MRQPTAHKASWKVAYLNQYNLLFLAGVLAFSLALASRWPLIIGGAVEVLWLLLALTSRRARRWAARHILQQDHSRREVASQALARGLEPAYTDRIQKLEVIGADIRRLVWERSLERALYSGDENRLESLLLAFIRMSALHQRLSRFVGNVSPAQMEQELLGLGQSLSAEKDPSVRFLLQQALSIAQRRFEQHSQLDSQLRLLGVRMGTLEMSLEYLRSQVFAGRSEQDLSAEIAHMMTNLSYLVELETEVNTSVERIGPPPLPKTVPAHGL
jgi:hypothetical protein